MFILQVHKKYSHLRDKNQPEPWFGENLCFSSWLLMGVCYLLALCHIYVYFSFCNLALNLFLAIVLILYPLNTPENKRFSGVFRGYKMGTFAWKGLIEFTLIEFTLLLKQRFAMKFKSLFWYPDPTLGVFGRVLFWVPLFLEFFLYLTFLLSIIPYFRLIIQIFVMMTVWQLRFLSIDFLNCLRLLKGKTRLINVENSNAINPRPLRSMVAQTYPDLFW